MPFVKSSGPKTIGCIVPKDSKIVLQGELMKVGQKTLSLQTRFFILRDNSLFIYYNSEDKLPYVVIPMKGLYIN